MSAGLAELGDIEGAALRDHFAQLAAPVDAGEVDVRAGIRKLGAHGLLDLGASEDTGLPTMVRVVADVAAECLSSAFAVWGQRMVIEYMARSAHHSDTTQLRDQLAQATEFGTTAMAPALRDLAGIEPLSVTVQRSGQRLRLTGRIPWASNLFPGSVVVLPARMTSGARIVVRVRASDPGVRIKPAGRLLALNGTASGSITLEGAELPPHAVLSEDLPGFVRAIRPSFLLLQTAFCSGLAGRSLAEARQGLAGHNECFAAEAEELDREHTSVHARLEALAERRDPERVRDLLQVRLDAARIAVAATRLEATVRGGLGYLAESPTARRLREAAFLPIQAPTEGHLRWELSQYT